MWEFLVLTMVLKQPHAAKGTAWKVIYQNSNFFVLFSTSVFLLNNLVLTHHVSVDMHLISFLSLELTRIMNRKSNCYNSNHCDY